MAFYCDEEHVLENVFVIVLKNLLTVNVARKNMRNSVKKTVVNRAKRMTKKKKMVHVSSSEIVYNNGGEKCLNIFIH